MQVLRSLASDDSVCSERCGPASAFSVLRIAAGSFSFTAAIGVLPVHLVTMGVPLVIFAKRPTPHFVSLSEV